MEAQKMLKPYVRGGLVFAAMTWALAGVAHAQFGVDTALACMIDEDCEEGFVCGGEASSNVCESPTPEQCAPAETRRFCVLPPCKGDADCIEGWTCNEDTVETCETASPQHPEGQCTTTSQLLCTPPPCERDTDCVEGWACHKSAVEICENTAAPVCPQGDRIKTPTISIG